MALQQIQIARYDPTQRHAGAVGRAVQQLGADIQADLTRREEQERILQKEEQELASQTFGFEPDEDASESLQVVQQAAATDLVNDAAEYARLLRKGEITTEEFNKRNQDLQKQIIKIKQGHTFLEGAAGKFEEYQENPDLMSGYTSPETLAVMKGMKDGTISYAWNPENNRMEYQGTYMLDGKEVQMPAVGVGKEGAFPTPIDKTQDPSKVFDAIGQEVAKNDVQTWTKDGISYTGYQWDSPGVQDRFNAKIDDIVSNENTLISTAVDYLGYTPEQVDALQREGKLAGEVKNKLLAQAEASIGEGKYTERISAGTTLERQRAQDARTETTFNQQQEDREKAIAAGATGQPGLTPNKAYEVAAEQEAQRQKQNVIRTAFTPNKDGELTDIQGIVGLGNIQGAEYSNNTWSSGGEIEIMIKGLDEPITFETNAKGQLPKRALQFIYNQTGLGEYGGAKMEDLNFNK